MPTANLSNGQPQSSISGSQVAHVTSFVLMVMFTCLIIPLLTSIGAWFVAVHEVEVPLVAKFLHGVPAVGWILVGMAGCAALYAKERLFKSALVVGRANAAAVVLVLLGGLLLTAMLVVPIVNVLSALSR